MIAGTVAALWRYPVKSMQGEAVHESALDEAGLRGDRHWALRDVGTGKVLSAKRHPRLLEGRARLEGSDVVVELPDGRVIHGGDPEVSEVLSDWLGRAIVLEEATPATEGTYEFQREGDLESEILDIPCPDGTFFDFGAVHLITTSSIERMRGSDAGVDWDLRRFRPTALVTTGEPGFVEDAWVNQDVVLGTARLYVTIPTPRCAIPMRAQPGLPASVEVMRALKREHDALLGVYGAVVTPGRVAVGDSVEVA